MKAQRRWLSTVDRMIIKSCHSVFKRKPLHLSMLKPFGDLKPIDPSQIQHLRPAVTAMLAAEARHAGSVRLKDILYEALGGSVEQQTTFQALAKSASQQTWFNSTSGLAGTQLMLSWVAEWQCNYDAAVEHAEASFRTMLMATVARQSIEKTTFTSQAVSAMGDIDSMTGRNIATSFQTYQNLKKWIGLSGKSGLERDKHWDVSQQMLAEIASHYGHVLLLQALHSNNIGDLYYRELDGKQVTLLTNLTPRSDLFSSRPTYTPLLHNELYPTLAALALHKGEVLWSKYPDDHAALLRSQLYEALALQQELCLEPRCHSHKLSGLIDTALASATMGEVPGFVHACSMALRIAQRLHHQDALAMPLRVACVQLHATLAQVCVGMTQATNKRRDVEVLVDLALATSQKLSSTMTDFNKIVYLSKGRWAVDPHMQEVTLRYLSASPLQVPIRAAAFQAPLPAAYTTMDTIAQLHPPPKRSRTAPPTGQQRQAMIQRVVSKAYHNTETELAEQYRLLVASSSQELQRVQRASISHLLMLYDEGEHESAAATRLLACDLARRHEPNLSPLTQPRDMLKAAELAASLALCSDASLHAKYAMRQGDVAARVPTQRIGSVLYSYHSALNRYMSEVEVLPYTQSEAVGEMIKRTKINISVMWEARPQVCPKTSRLGTEIEQPIMDESRRAYQARLAEITHWFWQQHAGWLALCTNERPFFVSNFAAFMQHLRGVVLESQAAGVSRSVLGFLLGRRS
eukprot:TRINITY_DN12311_c0_g1_i1.p1 TRINITY_DN12311_c0_g1~~TRINITY_DN12311_c0_g1_i1.p1  ORF type:complete len:746 (+),score=137.00 TRINITY_DN12311_c0_g1_i1:4388-6625(+)